LRKRAVARVERAIAIKMKRVMAISAKRMIARKSKGNGKEGGDGKQ
jgi:hypothetical protein